VSCAASGCKQKALRYQVFHGALCCFCLEHHTMAVRVHRELPMAIQEFHGLTLMLAGAAPRLQLQYFEACQSAEAHVRILRSFEHELE